MVSAIASDSVTGSLAHRLRRIVKGPSAGASADGPYQPRTAPPFEPRRGRARLSVRSGPRPARPATIASRPTGGKWCAPGPPLRAHCNLARTVAAGAFGKRGLVWDTAAVHRKTPVRRSNTIPDRQTRYGRGLRECPQALAARFASNAPALPVQVSRSIRVRLSRAGGRQPGGCPSVRAGRRRLLVLFFAVLGARRLALVVVTFAIAAATHRPGCGTAPVQASGTQADAVIGFAKNQLGKAYAWGAIGLRRYDCSGLVLSDVR